MSESDEPNFTVVSISYAGDGDRYMLELFDSKVIDAAKKGRKSRRELWDIREHNLEREGMFPFILSTQRVFLPVTNGEFMRLAPFVGMRVRIAISVVGSQSRTLIAD